ncbi:hypothetical protein CCR75_008595 [Bremia lactucae]|uniref:ELMO domain-containing protein n=1 Tax=Bremia lactucae TaxID=4779 RepID=A0A976FR52_BRELC|nr:hypothetical protein CCR75_008595 [Bremia lactucae]
MAEYGVLCRYFFQQMLVEGNGARSEVLGSSFLLSSHPTLAEMRCKFPFRGLYHFRLKVVQSDASLRYLWKDLIDEEQALPVTEAGEICVKVLQVAPSDERDRAHAIHRNLIDVAEDRQYHAFFNWQSKLHAEGYSMPQPQHFMHQDVGRVFIEVKKALTSKMKGSTMAQTLQKHSAHMWEKVAAATGVSGGPSDAPPTAEALAHLAKLIGAMKTPLHPGNHEHVNLLRRLWTSCFDAQPFRLTSLEWNRLGFQHGDPMREMQFLLPLQSLVFFHEAYRTVALPILNDQNGPEAFAYVLVGSEITQVLAEILQLRDGGCLGLERPFWRLFEDPMAFYELYCLAFRSFNASWKQNSTTSLDINGHINNVANFAQKLLGRGPINIPSLVEQAKQMQNW